MNQVRPSPPQAPSPLKLPHEINQLGKHRIDDYFWMKDDNWQAVLRDPGQIKPDVKAQLLLENAYAEAMMASTQGLQETLFAEMKGRIKEDDSSVPLPDGPWEYYTRFDAGAQHSIHARRARTPGGFGAPLPPTDATRESEIILLNEETAAKGHDYYATADAQHSPDHRLYAWAEDTQGSEVYTIRVRDIETGEFVGTPVESAYGSFLITPDSLWLFWIWRDDNSRPARIYRRPVTGGEDVLVYEEEDEGFFLSLSLSSSEQHILIGAGDHETNETRLIPVSMPTAEPLIVQTRETGVEYDVDHWGDRFVILTNADDAIDFKLMESTAELPSRDTWRDLIPYRPGVYITDFELFARYMTRTERENANTRVIVTLRADMSESVISVDEEAYALGAYGGYEYDTDVLRYTYTSPTTPSQTFDYHMGTREKVLRKTQVIPSGHNPADYVARRLYAFAPDGQEVPVTILMRRDTPLDGSAPLLLYGYGAYGMSMEPTFSIRSLSLVDRGWVWATAHVRGGTEKGYGWFLDGRKFRKTNTFSDFIACAEHLCAEGYSSRGQVVAYGGSAGGMLMGAVCNMRPDLWAGVIGAVPFVDVLNTMSDVSLPLTPPEWPEWGNPLEDPVAYDYIAAYSPYDNITAQAYPPVLATGGLSDPRVTYWEPMKWISRLRDYSTSGAPMLLKINMEAGHGGASGRFEFLKEIAFDYAFAIWAVEKEWQ